MTNNNNKQRAASPVWALFVSVKLTVVLLLILAMTSIIGTLIPQNGTEPYYIQKYGEVFYRLFRALDIFDMYNSWWFFLLLVLLSINIIVCSIDKLGSTWKIIFPDKVTFGIERFRRLKNREEFLLSRNHEDVESFCTEVVRSSFSTVLVEKTDSGVAIFGERGRWTRLGVYIVHLSILLLLAGALIGGIWGFKAFVSIPEGETVSTAFSRDNDTPVEIGFEIRCNSFDVSFYDTGQPKEFKSNLTVLEDGKESFTKDIIVNSPLRHKGISVYQSSYGIDSAKSAMLKIISRDSGMTYNEKMNFGQTIEIPESGGKFTLIEFVQGYNFQGHNLGEGFVGKLEEKGKPEEEIFLSVKFPTFDKMRRGAFSFEVQDYEKKYYTGLQITKDPGVFYVYAGFIFMIIGCWITFFMSHQSICVEISTSGKNAASVAGGKRDSKSSIVVSGTANRNSQSMKIKIAKIVSRIKAI